MKLKTKKLKRKAQAKAQAKRKMKQANKVAVPSKFKPRHCKFAPCGDEFTPKVRTQIYCSYRHKNAANQRRLNKRARMATAAAKRVVKKAPKPVKVVKAAA